MELKLNETFQIIYLPCLVKNISFSQQYKSNNFSLTYEEIKEMYGPLRDPASEHWE